MVSILKDLKDGNRNINCKTYGSSSDAFNNALEIIDKEKYCNGIVFKRSGKENRIKACFLDKAVLTTIGNKFLKDSSMIRV